jgi:hypothetical protein
MDPVERIGWSLLWSGLFLILAAVLAEMSGTKANIGGHVVNTHVTATWVLGCLGLVGFANGLSVLAGNAQKKGADRRRDA